MCLNGQCHNSPGSYYCQCNKGYSLSPDGAFCLGKLRFINKLVWIFVFPRPSINTRWLYCQTFAFYLLTCSSFICQILSRRPTKCLSTTSYLLWSLHKMVFTMFCSPYSYNYIDSSFLLCSVSLMNVKFYGPLFQEFQLFFLIKLYDKNSFQICYI